MPRFFLCDNFRESEPIAIGGNIIITGGDANHISRSLRMKAGDKITVCDSFAKEYFCSIKEFSNSSVILTVEEIKQSETEPPYSAVLYQALPKSSKFEFIVQKAVEMGVTRIVPVLTERCISRPDEKSMDKKTERWQKIAEEAAKQCGRGRIPLVDRLYSYEEAVSDASQGDLAFLCYEKDNALPLGALLKQHEDAKDIRFIIGSEGGISEKEAAFALEKGLYCVNLGKRILRCETAPLFTLASICCVKELL